MTFPPFTATVGELVTRAAERFGDKDVLVADAQRLTFTDLDVRSRAVARRLLADGVVKGTRVALLAPNGVEWFVWWCALARIGATVAVLNTFVQPPELAMLLRASGATRLVTVPAFLAHDYGDELEAAFPALREHNGRSPLFLADAPLLRAVQFLGDTGRPWAHHAAEAHDAADDEFLDRVEAEVVPADELVVVFTSGSTGAPKAVVHTHGTAVRYSRNVLDSYVVEHDDVMFSSMPFFWVGGLGTALLPCLHVGATLVTQAAFEPRAALEQIERERATIVLGWPQQGRTMAEHPSRVGRDLSSVRRTSMPDLVGPAQQPPTAHADTLGMTETFGSHSNFDPYVALDPSKLGTSGPALDGMERRIVDPSTGAMLPAGAIGEICVRGYSLMAGLLGREREEVFDADGWYHTGDLGRLDDDGWVYFLGRAGEMVKTPGGANVTPSEVEAALLRIDGVLEAYVTGVAAPGGELVAAAVVPRSGAAGDADAVRAALRTDLSAYKLPSIVWLCTKDDLPFFDSGKIDKAALAQRLAKHAPHATGATA